MFIFSFKGYNKVVNQNKNDTDIGLAILKIDDESEKYDAIKFSNIDFKYGDKVYAAKTRKY